MTPNKTTEQPMPSDFARRLIQAQIGTTEQSDLISAHMEEYFKRWPNYRDKFTDLEWYHIFLDFSDKLHSLPPSPSSPELMKKAIVMRDAYNSYIHELAGELFVLRGGRERDTKEEREKAQQDARATLSEALKPFIGDDLQPSSEPNVLTPSPVGEAEKKVHPAYKGWDSIKLIGRVKDRFAELIAKKWDWRSFYNGWLEGRAEMLKTNHDEYEDDLAWKIASSHMPTSKLKAEVESLKQSISPNPSRAGEISPVLPRWVRARERKPAQGKVIWRGKDGIGTSFKNDTFWKEDGWHGSTDFQNIEWLEEATPTPTPAPEVKEERKCDCCGTMNRPDDDGIFRECSNCMNEFEPVKDTPIEPDNFYCGKPIDTPCHKQCVSCWFVSNKNTPTEQPAHVPDRQPNISGYLGPDGFVPEEVMTEIYSKAFEYATNRPAEAESHIRQEGYASGAIAMYYKMKEDIEIAGRLYLNACTDIATLNKDRDEWKEAARIASQNEVSLRHFLTQARDERDAAGQRMEAAKSLMAEAYNDKNRLLASVATLIAERDTASQDLQKMIDQMGIMGKEGGKYRQALEKILCQGIAGEITVDEAWKIARDGLKL